MSRQPSPALPAIAPALLRWYDRHRRTLPWRAPPGIRPDPYHVWLSEIMLQQTTVATVGPYYTDFLKRWPTLELLAAAQQEDVLAAWAGLGYYSRARNLHKCAQVVVADHGGQFPRNEPELLALPGIGPYTAAAITAIAFDKPANVVDGNVERVISRLFALATPMPALKPEIRQAAAPLVPTRRPGDYAQALMDLGATVCTPRTPRCSRCPLSRHCAALTAGNPETYPRRATKKARPVRHGIALLLTDRQGRLWLRRRPPEGLFGGMLEIPTSGWQDSPPALADALAGEPGLPARRHWQALPGSVRHIFTHFELNLALYHARTRQPVPGLWLTRQEAEQAGLPGLMRKVLSGLPPETGATA